MSNGWTPERRARQAQMIRQWRPWEKSTGPRTIEGKAASSRNANKGGTWKTLREMGRLLKRQAKALER